MASLKIIALSAFCFQLALLSEPPCVMELECAECVPENMPVVTSHRAANGSVRARAGEEARAGVRGRQVLAYPLHESLRAVCEAGRYRVALDRKLRHLLELGCQESVFEDVLHQVDRCGAPYQGRAYQMREPITGTVRHLATVCYDEDRAVAIRMHVTNAARNHLQLPPHEDHTAPLSLLGNFNHMFDAKTRHDAEKLYSDDARMNRRLHELFKHDKYSFAAQKLTSANLLSKHYFEDQNMRVTDFVSNKVAVWESVAEGNLRHLQRDVAKLLEMARPHEELEVYAGTHGVLSLRTGHARAEVFLRAARRFPVPRFVWTAVVARARRAGVALVLLNDPFVAVSEVRAAVFCDSACGGVAWLHELRRHRNYECPLQGLVFCCHLHNFTSVVSEMPLDEVQVDAGVAGMLNNNLFV
ncbi:uncharacterized protein LOC119189383 [Manduca sexta]|uniref:uncharacterized protein LOC119189383 n=1 Tax=Manduca sexta TaxID=7130 RepID=UPI00188F65C0|nr:uncharacterized protein LOC119189383 [Manduca sexta]